MMRLFHIQDSDRPAYIVATDWQAALTAWWKQIRKENHLLDDDDQQPDGINMIGDGELIIISQWNGTEWTDTIFNPIL
jgi:hypothetical protein